MRNLGCRKAMRSMRGNGGGVLGRPGSPGRGAGALRGAPKTRRTDATSCGGGGSWPGTLARSRGRPATCRRPGHTPRPPSAGPGRFHSYLDSEVGLPNLSRPRVRGLWPDGLAAVPAEHRARKARERTRPPGLCLPLPRPGGEERRKVRSRFPSGTGKVPETSPAPHSSAPQAASVGTSRAHSGDRNGTGGTKLCPWARGESGGTV